MNVQELNAILKDFCLTPALCGYESEMAYKIKGYFEKYTDDVRIDKVGNCIATFPGTDPEAPRIMVFGHTDQLGFIVRRIDDDGYIRVDRMGGIPEKVLPAKKLLVGKEDGSGWVPGTFGFKAHHITPASEKYKVNTIPELYIDIGAKSAEEVYAAGIQVGCPVVYAPAFRQLLNDRIAATSVDDRSGCVALVEVAERLSKTPHAATVFVVATVWEEFNLRGAMMANRTCNVDIGICIDGGADCTTPDTRGSANAKMGGGACLKTYTFHGRGTLNGTIVHRGLRDKFVECADRLGLPVQRTAGIGGLTDSAYLQLEGDGVAMLECGNAFRYTHSPNEVCDVKDIKAVGDIVGEMVCSLDKNFKLGRFEK
ncbi:M42 family metallopeptidase [Feifania hominis]|uniref:M20/M25/M40 family metallo-hydrolase n=1 Tax=Feifania hominis TaxID=2763660 RepID=A0A926HUC1_9FIRM|nr:M20/M25/M40 family metallo-hydrolase [Feifania hominis]MBC8535790.1 M20/M25/M40 family metallo-hydrolase [Feifania hominis]